MTRAREYRLDTTWRIAAPVDAVYRTIRDSQRWPNWWHGVEQVLDLEPGDASGVGRVQRYTWRGVLPYRLSFDLRVTRIEPEVALEGIASGELEGIGRWSFSGRSPERSSEPFPEHEEITVVRHEWHVRTMQRWMNVVAPLARPVFEWNHEAVMKRGAHGLARVLGVRLVDPGRTR